MYLTHHQARIKKKIEEGQLPEFGNLDPFASDVKISDISEELESLTASKDALEGKLVENYWLIGRALAAAKGKMAHGQWIPFLESHGINRRNASRYMRLYNEYQMGLRVPFETLKEAFLALEQPKNECDDQKTPVQADTPLQGTNGTESIDKPKSANAVKTPVEAEYKEIRPKKASKIPPRPNVKWDTKGERLLAHEEIRGDGYIVISVKDWCKAVFAINEYVGDDQIVYDQTDTIRPF